MRHIRDLHFCNLHETIYVTHAPNMPGCLSLSLSLTNLCASAFSSFSPPPCVWDLSFVFASNLILLLHFPLVKTLYGVYAAMARQVCPFFFLLYVVFMVLIPLISSPGKKRVALFTQKRRGYFLTDKVVRPSGCAQWLKRDGQMDKWTNTERRKIPEWDVPKNSRPMHHKFINTPS